ncbi:hypothetical protein SLA2020_170270 [Shorea laevis]
MHSESSTSEASNLPLKQIPGSYGLPFFGAIRDRWDFFYNEGKDKFFDDRSRKYQSTVFRTNMAPGPFIASDPRVVCLLDAVSFPILFDLSKVKKHNVLLGTFRPSWSFTGGYRICSYLDPSEPKHTSLKSFFLSIIATRHNKFIPLFQECLNEFFFKLQAQIQIQKQVDFNSLNDEMVYNYIFRLFCDKDPRDTNLGSDGAKLFDKWLFLQLAPLGTLGILPKFLNFLDDLFLHVFPFPFLLVKSDYNKLYDSFYNSAVSILDEATRFGIKRDEACHNLLFLVGFNTYAGLKVLFSSMIKWVGLAGEKLHQQLVDEIRTVVKVEGGVTFSSLEKMPLTKSVVYETLRIDPPVPYQYATAKEDMVIPSHDAAFEIKKGELIFGYQPFATKDPRVFENPEEFVPNRFVGEGKKLLKYVYWSNGRETENPTPVNKQCPAKDLVLLLSRVLLVEFFLRFDTFRVEGEPSAILGSSVTLKSLTPKATTT